METNIQEDDVHSYKIGKTESRGAGLFRDT